MIGNSAPLQLFGDFGFVGGEDTAPNPLQDNQTCINWYAEVNKQNAKEVVGLNGCPGLVELVAPPGAGVLAAQAIPVPAATVLALIHFDGTNGQTTYTDVFYHTITNHGAALTTSSPKFGTASLLCSSNFVSIASDPAFAFAGDFTVEGFVWLTAQGNQVMLAKRSSVSVNTWLIFDYFSGGFAYVTKSGTLTQINSSAMTLNIGTWYHWAFVRSGTTVTFYLNGVSQGTVTGVSGALADAGSDLTLGAGGTDGNNPATCKIDEFRISSIAQYTANFTPPTAPFADVPQFQRVWENDSTGFPLYNGSTGSYIGIPTAINQTAGQIRIYDRGGLTTSGTLGGDGNTYILAVANGNVLSPVLPNAFEAPIQTNDYNASVKFRDNPSGTFAGLLMPHKAGTFGVYGSTFGIANANIPQPPASSASGAKLWIEDYSTGTLHFDAMTALSVPPITGNWKGVAAFPCADFVHFAMVTSDSGTGNAWLHLLTVNSNLTAREIARYQFSAINSSSAFDSTLGFFSKSGWQTGSGFPVAMLDSALQNVWLGRQGTTNTLSVYSISGGQLQVPPRTITAFASTPGNIGGLFADAGACIFTDFTRYGYFTLKSPAAGTGWPVVSSITNLPVRGSWELPNDNTALVVIGNTCYLVTLSSPATPSAFANLALTNVGTLLTSIGPVSIRDNNAGGYAVIVDGPYGYLYNIATQVFSRITDPAFLGADTVAFIDGWWIFNQYSTNGSQTFYTQAQQYGIAFNASNFALKDGAPDNLRAVFENKEQLWLLGDKTTEVWYDAGGQYFAFQRLVGTLMQFGCKAAHSVARFSTEGQDGVILFGRSERGENTIIKTRGFSFDVVSTPAFSKEVAQYPITSDAIAYTYQEDTHEFYVLTFPTADVTWCYDAQSGLLHKRPSYDPYLQKFHRHRSNCFMNFQGMRIVGDYQCGSLYQLTRNAQTDAGWPLLARRRSPHIWDKSQRGRVFMASLQADFRPGVGNPSGLGFDPQAKLRISRDGGATFGQQWPRPIGQIGQYKTRTMWRKLAFGRDNVVELEVIDPVPRDLIGVTLRAFSS